MSEIKISVVIPVYGCKDALPELYKRLSDVLRPLGDYEIILVNDACPQRSWEWIEHICRSDQHVIGLELSRNFGQMKAIAAGLDYATGDYLVVMDCDLQDRPEEIPALLSKAMEGNDIVFARRVHRSDSLMKRFVSGCFYKVYSYATDGHYDPSLSNFSIITRQVADSYRQMKEEHRAYTMYLQWLGYRQATVDVKHEERFAGKSSYNFKKRIRLAMDILTSQSAKLLYFVMWSGLTFSIVSFLGLLIVLIRYLTMNIASGWTSITFLILLIGGINMVCLGAVGIYVGNIFMQVKKRPLYVVRTALNAEKNK